MRGDYGYIRRTEGADGDHIDAFMRGFDSLEEAQLEVPVYEAIVAKNRLLREILSEDD